MTTDDTISTRRIFLAALLGALPFALVALADDRLLGFLIGEDGPVEWAGAVAWLLAAALFAASLLRLRRTERTERRVAPIWLAGLVLITFLAAGEEISWGQRLFDYRTPDVVAEFNLQKEMNLHNLVPLDVRQEVDGPQKTGFARWLTFGRLGSLVWMGFLIVLPVAYRYIAPARWVALRARLPVPPLEVAVAGAAVYAAFVALRAGSERLLTNPEAAKLAHVSANELKESVVAVLFLVAAAHLWRSAEAADGVGSPAAPGRQELRQTVSRKVS